MKRLPLLLSTLLVSGVVFAQSATPPPPQEGGRERMREHMRERAEQKFGEADSNHDGNISQSEWQSARLREANEQFQKFDANRDGKISRAEMEQARDQRMAERGQRGGHGERFKAMDSDGDQQLSKAEIGDNMPRLAADFDRLDANHDGKLSRDEIRAGRGSRHDGDDASR
jgi:Ca2+-binding EF-hand superfamily protein